MFDGVEWMLSWVLAAAHALASHLFPAAAGQTWVLSIVAVSLLVRAALLPLYVRQVDTSTVSMALRTYCAQIRAAYPGDRRRQTHLISEAYRAAGVRRWVLWVPFLVQLPILLGLFQLLSDSVAKGIPVGGMSAELVASAQAAQVGGVPLTVSVSSAATAADAAVVGVVVAALIGLTVFSAWRSLARTVGRSAPVQARRLATAAAVVSLCVYGWAVPLGLLVYSVSSAAITASLSLWAARRVVSRPALLPTFPELPPT